MGVSEHFSTSGVDSNNGMITIHHSQMHIGSYYTYECGKSFIEICVELGLDKSDTELSF